MKRLVCLLICLMVFERGFSQTSKIDSLIWRNEYLTKQVDSTKKSLVRIDNRLNNVNINLKYNLQAAGGGLIMGSAFVLLSSVIEKDRDNPVLNKFGYLSFFVSGVILVRGAGELRKFIRVKK